MEDLSLQRKSIGRRQDVNITSCPELDHCLMVTKARARPEEHIKPGCNAEQII
jgi:hypothetical protein